MEKRVRIPMLVFGVYFRGNVLGIKHQPVSDMTDRLSNLDLGGNISKRKKKSEFRTVEIAIGNHPIIFLKKVKDLWVDMIAYALY